MPATMPCAGALRAAIERPDATGRPIRYRYVDQSDNLESITAMLHDAYAPLAAAGMRFLASHQDVGITQERMQRGETIVGLDDGMLVGIITIKNASQTHGSPFYDRPDVASVEQFAVRPSHQRRGIGATLLEFAECRARESGAAHIALDTSERATTLIEMYERRGYEFVEYQQWPAVNYRSVILAKTIPTERSSTQ